MKSRKLILILASVFTGITLLTLTVTNIHKVRWDKVPLIGDFVLEIELWSSAFDASYLNEPIKWYQLDEEPDDWEGNGVGSWFSFNPYTKNLLKDYMRSNNLGIVPDNWPDFEFRSNFEKCLETFEFVELGEPTPTNKTAEYVGNIISLIAGCVALFCWIIFFVRTKSDKVTVFTI